ncbi:MAG TPA: hypothetical protein VIL37_20570 [Natronosporangium sp.]
MTKTDPKVTRSEPKLTDADPNLYDHIAGLLETLGEDPGAVAAQLRSDDIRGVRGSALAHPVCRWLIRLVPDLAVVLGVDNVHVFRPGRGNAIQGVTVPMPAPVQAFVDRFDDGQYPGLELWLGPPTPPEPEPEPADPVRLLPQQLATTMQLPRVAARAPVVVLDPETVAERTRPAGDFRLDRDVIQLNRPAPDPD